MDQQIALLQWYERPAYKRLRHCIRTVIPRSLEAIKGLKPQLRAAPGPGSAAALASQISEYLREIAIAYIDIQAALESSDDSYRWTSIPGLASLVRDVAALTFDDVDHVPGGPYRFVMPKPRFEAANHRDIIAPDPLPFRGPDMPFGSTSHGGTGLFPAGWVPEPFSLGPPPAHSYGQFRPPAPGFGTFSSAFGHPYRANREGGAPKLSLPPPTTPALARSPVLDRPPPIGVSKRRRRNDASGSPSIAPPRLRRTSSVDMRSKLPGPDDPQFDSQPQRNSAPHEQQSFSLSHESIFHMDRMRSALEEGMKTALNGNVEFSQLRPIYTKTFKARCFAAIERGDFVPIEAFMCFTGEQDLRDKTLPQALLDRRKSRQRASCKAVANMQSLFTKDFASNVPKDASHLCHQKLYDLFWHILELGADNLRRNKCIQALARALRRGEAFPLDSCWCGSTPHCLLGPAALTDEEVLAYQWMAANNYASFGEIPIEALAGMEELTDESLDSVFTTWKVELRDDGRGRKSAWAVPVVSRTLTDLYDERIKDAAKDRGIIGGQSDETEGSDNEEPDPGPKDGTPERPMSVSLISAPRPHDLIDYSSLNDTQLHKHVSDLVNRRRKNRYLSNNERKEPADITKALNSELVACQIECFNRFVASAAGREMAEANSQMGGWGRGTSRTGMQCILESTIYYQSTDYDTRNPGAPGAPIKKGVFPWLVHMVGHTEWEEPVLCKVILFTLDSCPWIEDDMADVKRSVMEEVREELQNGNLPGETLLKRLKITKSGI